MEETYRKALKEGERLLWEHGVPDPGVDAAALLTYVTGKNRAGLFMVKDDPLPEEERKHYHSLLLERSRRIPLQHLTGEQEFMGLPFYCNENVLIPRQDTETLVETVLKEIRPGDTILDICTGSGCILISLLKLYPYATGVGVDLSAEALEVAGKNALRNEVKAAFYQSDIFDAVEKKYDIIVSNPPYIPTEIIPKLMPEVRDHDPRMALDGGADGLTFYRRITSEAAEHLHKNGKLFFEVGVGESTEVKAMMEAYGFRSISIVRDYSGNERVVYGHLEDNGS